MRRTTRYPVSGENSLWNVYKTVSFLEGNEKLYDYPNCTLYTFFIGQELVIPHIFADESRKENIVCAYGNARHYVPGKDSCGRKFDYRL